MTKLDKLYPGWADGPKHLIASRNSSDNTLDAAQAVCTTFNQSIMYFMMIKPSATIYIVDMGIDDCIRLARRYAGVHDIRCSSEWQRVLS